MLEPLDTLGRLWRHPRASREALLSFQARKLRGVVRWAHDTVPYYREVFRRSGISPDDIRTTADLAALPLTSTGDYRMRPLAETLARHRRPGSLVERATSGSSGRPFIIRRTVWEDHIINQFRWRAYASFGLRLRDRIARVRLCTPSHQHESLLGRARQAVGLRRQHDVSSLASAPEILQRLAALRPDAVMGYPSVLTHVAVHQLMAGRPVVRPRLIVTGGEALVPFRRERIATGFSARVFDVYGAHEFNLLAWECPRGGGYHVCDDNVALEILRDGRPVGPGERGEVVATALHCYAMPFLRYQLGDVATRGPEPCPCGQPFSTLRAVEGRMHDYFRMPDGSLLHPDTVVVPIMEAEAPWFDRYRLTQERVDRIVLQILPFERPAPERLARVRQLGAGHLPPGVGFHVEVVERLEAEGSGKFRFCRSLVESHLDGIDWARV